MLNKLQNKKYILPAIIAVVWFVMVMARFYVGFNEESGVKYGGKNKAAGHYVYAAEDLEREITAFIKDKKSAPPSRAYKIFFLLLMLLPLFFLGMVFLFLFAVKLVKGKKYAEEKITAKISLPAAWLIFIFWDILHLLAGFILYFFKVKISSISAMVMIYIAISIPPLLLISCCAGIRQFITSKSSYARDILWGFGGYCAILPLILAASAINQVIFQDTTISSNPVFSLLGNMQSQLDYFLLLVMVVIIGPAVEEIIFRGYLYTAFRKYFNFAFSALVVSFLFSFIHADVFALIPILCIGFVLSAVYEYTGSIVSSFTAHALWNLNTFLVFVLLFK